jgi:hypothetical protein
MRIVILTGSRMICTFDSSVCCCIFYHRAQTQRGTEIYYKLIEILASVISVKIFAPFVVDHFTTKKDTKFTKKIGHTLSQMLLFP